MYAWQIKVSGKSSAQQNMQRDYEELLTLTPKSLPSIRFYTWQQNCATYGYFLQPFDFLNYKELENNDLEIARRPTGGGILFHLTDLAFSVIVPSTHPYYSMNTLENYAFVNQRVIEALCAYSNNQLEPHLYQPLVENSNASSQFCMAKATKFDVMIAGKKVGGAAQRRTKQGFLHQGSISICLPSLELLEAVLLPGTTLLDEMKQTSYLLVEKANSKEIEEIRFELKKYLVDFICR